MKRILRTLILAVILFGYYRFSDGLFIYTYLYQWPGIWSLVGVEPA